MNKEYIDVPRVPPEPAPKRRGGVILIAVLLTVALGAQIAFPGRRTFYAVVIGTGLWQSGLQEQIDVMEDKAIRGEEFTAEDRAFLTDFYTTLATGAVLTWFVRQTGYMMFHYLEGSGEPYELEAEIFTGNRKVQRKAAQLRKRITPSVCRAGGTVTSGRFYMPDTSQIDSVFGLYYGTLSGTASEDASGTCRIRWRAEVPWDWPSYESLKKKHGRYHSENFPLPNIVSIFLGHGYALKVDNGLGHHLEVIGLATSFVAFGEWEEALHDK